MDSNIGKKLDGRYELLELIGVGGMADIYRARDIEADRIVAVKILKTEFTGSDEFLRRFRNESKAIALLSHPNIVKIYDVGFTDKVQFIVMEYVDGITLTDYIEQQGVLKWRDAVHFTVQILKALQHAHDRGIVHRDIKSSNVMLLSDGTIKVMDFGIARFNRENNKTMSEKTIGSVHYISPEQARGDITDERSDIYSVGVALYEMLTGRKPFDGDTPVAIALKHMQSAPKKPTEYNETIPEGLEQIVLRAMQKDPAHRYQTAGEMIKDLEEFKRNPGIVFEYEYNSTDGTAKYVAPSVRGIPERERRRRNEEEYEQEEEDEYDDEEDDDDEYEERRSPLIPILFAVGTAFIIATVFLVLTMIAQRIPSNETISEIINPNGTSNVSMVNEDEFTMPNMIGMTWKEAVEKYSSFMELVPEQEWSTVTKDEIFDQEFPEGRKVKIGQSVTVKVSKGIRKIEIQDLTDRSASAAEQQLKKDGFVVRRTYIEDDEIQKDNVIRTEPAAHELADEGSTVVLFISMGAKNSVMSVPNLRGMPLATALERCKEYHLNPDVSYVDSEEEKDKVLKQDPEPGTTVERDSTVYLEVSSGEIPEYSRKLQITLPTKATGEFIFKYYVDGVLDTDRIETRDISLSANKMIEYTLSGREGEERNLVINVESTATGKSGTYMEIAVKFERKDEDSAVKGVHREIARNSKIFSTLQIPDESEETMTPTPVEVIETIEETQPPEEDTSAPESQSESQPESQANSEPSEAETTPPPSSSGSDTSEPETAPNNGGIPVE